MPAVRWLTLLGLYSLMSLPLALAIPWIAVRVGNPLGVVIAGLACYLVGYAGLAFAPSRAPLLWTVACGLAAIGPFLTGLLHSLTGAWAASFGFLALALVPLTVGGAICCRPVALEETLQETLEGTPKATPERAPAAATPEATAASSPIR